MTTLQQTTSRRRLRRALFAAATIPALLIAGAAYQAVGAALDARRHPAPGELVEVGGHQLHLQCTGRGSPTVVLEAGLPGSALDFALVLERLGQTTHVCAYDRAGYGYSDPADGPRDSVQLAEELHGLLSAAGKAPPYVLVGHSFGGYIARIYADRYRDEVAGLVLVDSSHEDQHRRFEKLCSDGSHESQCQAIRENLSGLLGSCTWLAPLGVMRLAVTLGLVPEADGAPYPPELAARAEATTLRTSYCATVLAEYTDFPGTSAEQVRNTEPLGDLPLVVISHGVARSNELGLPPEVSLTAAEGVWHELQTELAGLSSKSTHLDVEESGHFIPLERPQAVADAVAELVVRLRSGTASL